MSAHIHRGQFMAKYPAKAFDSFGHHVGPGPWMSLIWAANEISEDFFGQPETHTEDDGRYFEDYPEATVIIGPKPETGDPRDEWVIVSSKTDHGAEVLRAAEASMLADD